MTVCAIHQPNFFPWAGYFDKIRRADIFIFLDEVAYPKSGSGAGSWCNRVRLLSAGQPDWYGLPIKRESGVQLIRDVNFIDKDYGMKKIARSLLHNYQKSKFYTPVMLQMEELLSFPGNNLAEFNINAIMKLAAFLGLKTQFIRQSELQHSRQATGLLIELLEQVNADTYLCGNGCASYQDDSLFGMAGIKLLYQNYDPFKDGIFAIKNECEAGLSVIHHLFMNGRLGLGPTN